MTEENEDPDYVASIRLKIGDADSAVEAAEIAESACDEIEFGDESLEADAITIRK